MEGCAGETRGVISHPITRNSRSGTYLRSTCSPPKTYCWNIPLTYAFELCCRVTRLTSVYVQPRPNATSSIELIIFPQSPTKLIIAILIWFFARTSRGQKYIIQWIKAWSWIKENERKSVHKNMSLSKKLKIAMNSIKKNEKQEIKRKTNKLSACYEDKIKYNGGSLSIILPLVFERKGGRKIRRRWRPKNQNQINCKF